MHLFKVRIINSPFNTWVAYANSENKKNTPNIMTIPIIFAKNHSMVTPNQSSES